MLTTFNKSLLKKETVILTPTSLLKKETVILTPTRNADHFQQETVILMPQRNAHHFQQVEKFMSCTINPFLNN